MMAIGLFSGACPRVRGVCPLDKYLRSATLPRTNLFWDVMRLQAYGSTLLVGGLLALCRGVRTKVARSVVAMLPFRCDIELLVRNQFRFTRPDTPARTTNNYSRCT